MKRFHFGPNFLKWIQTLYSYSNPQASIRVNLYKSRAFKLERGCRQGCALSPLLFAISKEPLAQLMRESSVIKGIVIGGEEHKILLSADDVLLYSSNTQLKIPQIKKNESPSLDTIQVIE